MVQAAGGPHRRGMTNVRSVFAGVQMASIEDGQAGLAVIWVPMVALPLAVVIAVCEEALKDALGPEDLRSAPPAPGAFEEVARSGGDGGRGPGVDDRGDGHEPVLAAGEDPKGHAPG
jgi:hypothetical protein